MLLLAEMEIIRSRKVLKQVVSDQQSPPIRPAVIHQFAVATDTPATPRMRWLMIFEALIVATGFVVIGIIFLMVSRK